MLKIKRIGIIAILFLFILSIMGCKSKTADENKIKEDIINNGVDVADIDNQREGIKNNMSVDQIESLKITDRKTSTDSKSDVILAEITMKSSNFIVTGNFKITYNLYDDGWKLIDVRLNEEHYNFSYDGNLTDDDITELIKEKMHDKSVGKSATKYELEEIENIELCNEEPQHETMTLDIANLKIKMTENKDGTITHYEANCKLSAKAINSSNEEFNYCIEIKDKKKLGESFSDDFELTQEQLKSDLTTVPIKYYIDAYNVKYFTNSDISDVKWNGEYERLSNGSVTLKNVTLTVNKNLEKLTNGTVTIKHLGYYLDDGKWVSEIEKTKGAKEDNMIIYSVYQFINKN